MANRTPSLGPAAKRTEGPAPAGMDASAGVAVGEFDPGVLLLTLLATGLDLEAAVNELLASFPEADRLALAAAVMDKAGERSQGLGILRSKLFSDQEMTPALAKAIEKILKEHQIHPLSFVLAKRLPANFKEPSKWMVYRDEEADGHFMDKWVAFKQKEAMAMAAFFKDAKKWIPYFLEGGGLRFVGETQNIKLPPGLHLFDRLEILESPGLRKLGAVHIGTALTISECPEFTEIDPRVEVGSDISITKCPSLRTLPAAWLGEVAGTGDVDFSDCTGLEALPEGACVSGDLNLTNCTGLTGLPKSLEVGGALNVTGCSGIPKIPLEAKVEGDILA